MAEPKQYALWVCNDDASEMTAELIDLFHSDHTALMERVLSEDVGGAGSVYHLTDHDEHGEERFTAEEALLLLKGKAFDEQWCREDMYMLLREPDGTVTGWEY